MDPVQILTELLTRFVNDGALLQEQLWFINFGRVGFIKAYLISTIAPLHYFGLTKLSSLSCSGLQSPSLPVNTLSPYQGTLIPFKKPHYESQDTLDFITRPELVLLGVMWKAISRKERGQLMSSEH